MAAQSPTDLEVASECWVLTEGHAGMENQARGLAERLGLPYQVKRVRPRAPWTWLPPGWWPLPLAALGRDSDVLEAPWPDLLISSGRRSVPYALAVGALSHGRTRTVHIGNPRVRLSRFNLVIAPRHDRLRGGNLIETVGALHRVTPARLADEGQRFAAALDGLPRPLLALLIGGSTRHYRVTAARLRALGEDLRRLAAARPLGIAVTPSRRTPPEALAALRQGLGDAPAQVWDGHGENPYFGYLAAADMLLVTEDSVTMISEAAATGKPVYVLPLEGRGSGKFRRFHSAMERAGHTRRFAGELQSWAPPAFDETGAAAEALRRRLDLPAAGRPEP